MSRDKNTNRIDISLAFYFKGERYTPTASIALDDYIDLNAGLPEFHQLLAKQNNIDLMSYQYEIMLGEDVHISNAQGLVANYVSDGRLDAAGFIQAWREQGMSAQLQSIAQQHLGIADLEDKPELRSALAAAFKLGQETR